MPDLSVIIPIYNTPLDKLDRCFRSLCSLEGCAFEALLIDDGSAVLVGEYCRKYAAENPAFRYIFKENGGVSSARNRGIAEANGRYITFLDADDSIMGEPLVQCLPKAEGPDMIVFDILLTQRGSNGVWHGFDRKTGVVTREQMLYQLITTASISGPCAKLYKTQIIRDRKLCFDAEFISGEDWMFVSDCILAMESFCYCAQTSYQYFREESTGQSRMVRFPDRMLSNQLARFARKQQLIAAEQWTEHTQEQILSLAAVELIENLFNSAAELWLEKQYTPERKRKILCAVTEAGTLLAGQVPKKTKLKLWVLTRCTAVLGFLAQLRSLYLKGKS